MFAGCCRSSALGFHTQGAVNERQIGQGEKRVELGRVLGQAAVTGLAIAEEVLEDVKRVFDQSAPPGLGFLDAESELL